MSKMKYLLILSLALFLASCSKKEKVDLILFNAKIYTVDSTFSECEAMAIKDGKIVFTGTLEDAESKFIAKEKVDAQGKTILPGLNDAHSHFYGYAMSLSRVDLRGSASLSEVIQKTLAFSKDAKEEWIMGRGWDQNLWTSKEFPTKDSLDFYFPDRPVVLKRVDGHAALLNSVALKLAGITTKTKVTGGMILQEKGKLTGILIDNAVDLVEAVIPKPSNETIAYYMLKAQKNCFEAGLTTVTDAGLDVEIVQLIDSMQLAKSLKMQIYAMLNPDTISIKTYLKNGIYKTNRLNVSSVKIYGDGALGSRGAFLKADYTDKHHHRGFPLFDSAYFMKWAVICNQYGYQMNTHCIGDSAVALMLNIYGSQLKGKNDKRWRIEHAQIVEPVDREHFINYSIIPSMQPTHATSDMYWAEDRVGKERIKNAYSLKEMYQLNNVIALGSDFPVEQIHPILGIHAAVSRQDVKGFPEGGFNKKSGLTLQEAIKGFTIFAAYSSFDEKIKGSLEQGKNADFIIVDQNPFEMKESDLYKLKVLSTYVQGELVYKKETKD